MKYILIIFLLIGCNKQDYLNENLVSELKVPATLEDLELLLENSAVLNDAPGMGDASADDYYLSYTSWNILAPKDRNTYIWAKDIYMGAGNIPDWDNPYKAILHCNIALRSLNKIGKNSGNEIKWKRLKGSVLFLRSFAFYHLSQIFILPYDSHTAATDLGLPLRLTDNVQEKSVRSTVQQTYDQVIVDLKEARTLLPVQVDGTHPNRPTLPAVFALLSKVYLSMRRYEEAGDYADSCLQLHNQLLDYNNLNAGITPPFNTVNPEILFYSHVSTNSNLLSGISRGTNIDSALYQYYDSTDLRRSLYFITRNNGSINIRSSYAGVFPFSGLATDEMYLARAECRARTGKIAEALADVNALLANRYTKNTFVPFTDTTADELLLLIFNERRKELPFRNCRFTDLRRFNKEGREIMLTRVLNEQTFQLQPNSGRYVLPIPPDVIALSGIQQNER